MKPFVAACFAALVASALLTNVHSKMATDLDVQESRK
jgi:hypothetical protein